MASVIEGAIPATLLETFTINPPPKVRRKAKTEPISGYIPPFPSRFRQEKIFAKTPRCVLSECKIKFFCKFIISLKTGGWQMFEQNWPLGHALANT
jgi:hypothetical protein